MARRITSMLLVILLLAGIIPSAFAAEGTVENEDEIVVLASSGKTVTITVDRNRQIQWIGHSDAKLNLSYQDATGTTRGGYMNAVNVTKVDGVIAYCIEPCVEFGSTYTEDEATAAWMTQLTANQRSAIALAIAYGYPNTDHPAASDPGVAGDTSLEYPLRTDLWQNAERYAATQIIVWEIVTGKRSAVAPYTCTDDSLYTSFYRTSNPYGYRADWNTLRDTYKRISDSMAAHKTVPSFSSSSLSKAPTHQLNYNSSTGKYEITLTDTNQVLSGYEFTCSVDGVTVTQSGNTLQISATAEAAAKLNGATVSAAGTMLDIDPEKVVAVWAAQGAGQTAVTLKTSPDPVTAYFKLSAQATSEVLIKKTTNTGANLSGWQINLYTDAACTKKVSGSPFTTGADGTIKVTNLTPGTYYAKEVASSDPYWVSDTSVKTVVAEAGKTATVTFSNTHYGDLKVKKTAINGSAEGWNFEIYDANGSLVETITTGADGYAYSKKLLPGKYTVKEIDDKDDTYWIYDAQVEKQAQVTAGNQTLVQYTNEQVGQVEIVKTTNTGANLGGWKINLYTDAGCTKLVAGSPFTTDSSGKIVVPDLKPGTYYAKEVTSSDPYWVSDSEVKNVKVEAGKTAKVTFSNTHYGDLRIKKNAINGSAEGWKFQIYDANGSLVETIITGSDGYAYSKKLLPGKYTVKEIHDKDDTYWIYDAQVEKQVQVTAGNQAQVEYTNEQVGQVEIVKTTNTGANLGGWKINLYTDAGCTKLVAGSPFTTDSTGKIVVPDLKPGTYYAKEVASSDPYWVSDTEVKNVKVEAGKTASVTFKNTHYGDLKVKKNAINGSAEGWKFELYDSTGKLVETITTGTDGYAYAKKLLPGKYTVKEIHDKDDTYWIYDAQVEKQVQITAGNQAQVEYTNEQIGQLELIKTTNTGANLGGWKINLYTDAACTKKVSGSPFTTGADGKIIVPKLKPGTYYAKEVASNDPYWASDTEAKTVKVEAGKTAKVTFSNTHYGDLRIKKNAINGSAEGWKFQIYDANGNLVQTITTGADGYAYSRMLLPGKYTVKEIHDRDDTYWTYDATVVKQTQITAGQQSQVEYTNEQFGLLEFRKTTNTQNHLAGWKFQVKDANGKLVGEYTTDANGYACTGKLKPGRYYVQEVGSSDPYWICDVTSYPVDVTAGKTVGHSATNIELGKGTFHKTTNTGANLDGWEITIYEDVSCKKPIAVITTDAKGYGELYLEPGTYYAKETGDTKGRFEDEYWAIDTRVQEFKIEAHKDTAVTFVNTHHGKGKVIKTMATDGSLEDWQFKITDASGKEIEGSPFASDKHGNILTGNLLPGTYTVEELIPENSLYYCKTPNPQTITIVEGKTVSVTFTNALRPGKISIEKVNIKGDHLEGATFRLEWSQDGINWSPVSYSDKQDVVLGGCSNAAVKDGCLTTGKDGIAEWGNLYPGIRYRITEVEAPDGYLLLKGYAYEGELLAEDLTVSLTVVNSREFEIPATGSNGVTFMAMAQVLCFGLCMTMLLFQRKRS